MYIVQSVVNVPQEKADEVIGLYQGRSRMVDAYDGFVSFQLLQNERDPGELTVHMTWQDEGSYVKWVQSDAFRKVHELEKNYPDQELSGIKPTVRRYKVVAH
ncbi:antibiotic biosynthesis monooxygenase [Paenibacillus sp. IB182496]|uniref:Antibiotic biosynthesis monooxygenase n=1 Tax=Paenibacillus sabuli TaxID=2772509 RepID=A0A927BVY2_9BACL|nr:antibiotic biosynthesis monooxygenase family protein [Paenibacillus sabuli]MBD2846891.1 antibiotic biosynthesis monooxygenase [Paenibacillus sabuli]